MMKKKKNKKAKIKDPVVLKVQLPLNNRTKGIPLLGKGTMIRQSICTHRLWH